MINLHTGIAIVSLFLILFGLLHILQKYRVEGFEEYKEQDLSDISNPILKVLKKIGTMTVFFANPSVWTDAYAHSQMSITDLARKQIEKDAKNRK